MSAPEKLLAEFPPVGTGEWEAAIAADLKGACYDETMIWHLPEGLSVRPYYRADDARGLDWAGAAPGSFPFVRGARSQPGWLIREEIAAPAPADANRAAAAAVAAGAEEIAFRGVSIANQADLGLLLANLGEIPVHIACADEASIRLLLEFLHGGARAAAVSAEFDPFGNLAFAAECLAVRPAGLVPFFIEAARAAPPGAHSLEQAGWALAAAVDFLGKMEERSIDPERAAAALEFSFSVDGNYFFAIARLRAFRMLWARVVESFGGSRRQGQARIAVRTAYPPARSEDSHWNMLRATTQTMSAILGGADSICIAPFASAAARDDEAARRLVRNTQLLLKHEAFFARVADPGGGSYYLESLTGAIAAAAWKVMQAIEACGGFGRARSARRKAAGS